MRNSAYFRRVLRLDFSIFLYRPFEAVKNQKKATKWQQHVATGVSLWLYSIKMKTALAVAEIINMGLHRSFPVAASAARI